MSRCNEGWSKGGGSVEGVMRGGVREEEVSRGVIRGGVREEEVSRV